MTVVRSFFIGLSKSPFLNTMAKKYGLKLGAQQVVAGTNVVEVIESIKKINARGISCTVDNLGEFVDKKEHVLEAKAQILAVIEAIHQEQVDAHISLKLSQLGLDIDKEFCEQNTEEIIRKATQYNVFVNVDMEDYKRLQPSLDIVEKLAKQYKNIGTVIQAYFFRAEDDLHRLKNFRLRIVKGAYKESEVHAYTDKADIDKNFIKLIKWHLLNGRFTSIATHDHHIIDEVKQFVKENNISNDKFEFQMLYGFRTDLQEQLAYEGYQQCIYVPFGNDWFGYFMRRLAERPQNLKLVTQQVFTKKINITTGLIVTAFLLSRKMKR